MANNPLFDRVKMSVSGSPGTGTITLNSALAGFRSFDDAGVADGDTVSYLIEQGSEWEIGKGVYTASGTTLSRDPNPVTNEGPFTLLDVTSAANVYITAFSYDLVTYNSDGEVVVESNLYVSNNLSVTGELSVTQKTTFSEDLQIDRKVNIDGAGDYGEGNIPKLNIVSDEYSQDLAVIGPAPNAWFRALNDYAESGSDLWLIRARGEVGSEDAIEDGDTIGNIRFAGNDGYNHEVRAAEIVSIVDGSVTTNVVPAALVFKTATVYPYERMRITPSGDVLIGTSTSGASKLVVDDSSIQIKSSKTPASATDTGSTGQIAWDNNYIYVCVYTNTWVRALLSTW